MVEKIEWLVGQIVTYKWRTLILCLILAEPKVLNYPNFSLGNFQGAQNPNLKKAPQPYGAALIQPKFMTPIDSPSPMLG